MFAYCANNPACTKDASGHALDYLRDVAFLGVCAVAYCTACAVCASGVLDQVAEKVISYVQQILEEEKKLVRRDQTVYVMCYLDEAKYGKDTVGYVGRTNDLNRRKNEHRRDRTKDCLGDPIAIVTGLTIDEAKVVEQMLISAYTLDALENRRREIGINKLSAAEITDYIISLEMGVAESEILCLMER